jgi:hypothetical protein
LNRGVRDTQVISFEILIPHARNIPPPQMLPIKRLGMCILAKSNLPFFRTTQERYKRISDKDCNACGF